MIEPGSKVCESPPPRAVRDHRSLTLALASQVLEWRHPLPVTLDQEDLPPISQDTVVLRLTAKRAPFSMP